MVENERKDDNTGDSGGKSPKKLRVLLRTFGCQMNERDSEAVTGLLLQNGWEIVESAEKADAALLNTCSVRDHAERRVMGWLNKMQHLKLTRPGLVVGILGCMAQLRQKTFFEASPAVDVVCGPGNLKELPKLLAKAAAKRQRQVLAVDRLGEAYGLDGIEYRRNRVRALVTIMTGCDNACTYCVVPAARGRERSRSADKILREVRDLAGRGFKDITLLGQNVNSYGHDLKRGIDFVGLLKRIVKEAPGLPRLRFMTSHPKDAHTQLLEAMRDLPMVCPHLHLPVQSGSDRILSV